MSDSDLVPTAPHPNDRRPSSISREDVITAFRVLLGRFPETEQAIEHHRHRHTDVAELGKAIRNSAEFRFLRAHETLPDASAGPSEPAIGPAFTMASYKFDRDAEMRGYLRDGWSAPEDPSCWSIGPLSKLELPCPALPAHTQLSLVVVLRPFEQQVLSVCVNGRRLTTVNAAGKISVGCVIPAALIKGQPLLQVTFEHPDAKRPCDSSTSTDTRLLGFSFEQLDLIGLRDTATEHLSDGDVMRRFVSLGDNCEFGFLQRRCGVEPVGLLRFSTMPMPHFMRGMRTDFADFPDRLRLSFTEEPRRNGGKEYIVREANYNFAGHTGLRPDVPLTPDTTPTYLDREKKRLTLLTRLMLQEMTGNEAIFVYRRLKPISESEIVALWLALKQRGDTTLLWVSAADHQRPAGLVEVLQPGLLHGYVDRLAPYDNAEDVDIDSWLSLCRSTLRILKSPQATVDVAPS